jgi:pectin methylesterase-like acyl-CoA thioesterase
MARKYCYSTPTTIALWASIIGALVLATVLARTARAAGPACTVNAGGGADYTTIQDAVNDTSCTSILVTPGIYREHVEINRNLTLRGSQAATTIVDGSTTNTVFVLGCRNLNSGTVHLSDITIQNGFGGICNRGTLTLANSIITNNTASGISNEGTATISNTAIVSNTASGEFGGGSGAGIFNSGILAIDHSDIISNTVFGGGGGLRPD